MENGPKQLSRRDREMAEDFGGAEDFVVYDRNDLKPYCDKPNHAQRSIANQPNHAKHGKKGG